MHARICHPKSCSSSNGPTRQLVLPRLLESHFVAVRRVAIEWLHFADLCTLLLTVHTPLHNNPVCSRQDLDFLSKSAQSDQARFIVLDAASNPLVTAEGTGDVHDIVKSKLEGGLLFAICHITSALTLNSTRSSLPVANHTSSYYRTTCVYFTKQL